MTGQIYSIITMVYMVIIAATAFVVIQNKYNRGYSLFGKTADKMIPLAVLATMGFMFATAYSIDFAKSVLGNFSFIMCIVGIVVFTVLFLTGASFMRSDADKVEMISKRITELDNKIDILNKDIADRNKYIASLATPEERNEAKCGLNELVNLRKEYKTVRAELISQKAMFSAKIENRELDKIGMTSSKNAIGNIRYHKNRMRANRNMDDNLYAVRDIMNKY